MSLARSAKLIVLLDALPVAVPAEIAAHEAFECARRELAAVAGRDGELAGTDGQLSGCDFMPGAEYGHHKAVELTYYEAVHVGVYLWLEVTRFRPQQRWALRSQVRKTWTADTLAALPPAQRLLLSVVTASGPYAVWTGATGYWDVAESRPRNTILPPQASSTAYDIDAWLWHVTARHS